MNRKILPCPKCQCTHGAHFVSCPEYPAWLEARLASRAKNKPRTVKKSLRDEMFETVYHAAQARGALAATKHVPTPMVVSQHANPFDDSSEVQQSWHAPSGVCGFAWVVVKPGTSSFARWLLKHGHAKPHYWGGVSIWIGGYGQCYEKKVAHASAMAAYLRQVGIHASAQDRLD